MIFDKEIVYLLSGEVIRFLTLVNALRIMNTIYGCWKLLCNHM